MTKTIRIITDDFLINGRPYSLSYGPVQITDMFGNVVCNIVKSVDEPKFSTCENCNALYDRDYSDALRYKAFCSQHCQKIVGLKEHIRESL